MGGRWSGHGSADSSWEATWRRRSSRPYDATSCTPFDEQILIFLDEQREAIDACLDDITEEQARRKLVHSETTLLGLVRHATFVERVWFGEPQRPMNSKPARTRQ